MVARERIYWADPNAFDLLRLPVFAGDLTAALRRPDGVVLTRSSAEKYFGRDDTQYMDNIRRDALSGMQQN
jgi:putative ABC transport system permease protein